MTHILNEAVDNVRAAERYLRSIGESWYADLLSDAIDMMECNGLNNAEFMMHIISEICDYAVQHTIKPDDALGTIADDIKALLEISTFNYWAPKEEAK